MAGSRSAREDLEMEQFAASGQDRAADVAARDMGRLVERQMARGLSEETAVERVKRHSPMHTKQPVTVSKKKSPRRESTGEIIKRREAEYEKIRQDL